MKAILKSVKGGYGFTNSDIDGRRAEGLRRRVNDRALKIADIKSGNVPTLISEDTCDAPLNRADRRLMAKCRKSK